LTLKALIVNRKDNGPKIIKVNAFSEMRNLSLEILDKGSKAALEAYTDWQCKIDDIRERSIRHSAEIDELGCVKALVAGIRNYITKFKGTNYLYGQWNQLPQDKCPLTCDELATWGINVIRDVMIHIEYYSHGGLLLNGPTAQHYKKPNAPPPPKLQVKKLPASSPVALAALECRLGSCQLGTKIIAKLTKFNHCGVQHSTVECRRRDFPSELIHVVRNTGHIRSR
jgi:hypothetical protein